MREQIMNWLPARSSIRPALTLLRRVLTSPALSRGAGLKLALVIATAPWSSDHRCTGVRVPGGKVFVGGQSPLIDITTILDVWEGDMFPAHCAGRVVLDIGAHKGYFGAWALAQGADAVISCEPHPENFTAMARCHAANLRQRVWDIERVAVGGTTGRARLYVSEESWAHSFYDHMIDGTSWEEVDVVDLGTLLARADDRRAGAPIVLKLNVEGAAGAALLPVSPDQLTSVVEVQLDHEPGSPYAVEDILGHLARAGLTEVTVHLGRLFQVRRPGAAAVG